MTFFKHAPLLIAFSIIGITFSSCKKEEVEATESQNTQLLLLGDYVGNGQTDEGVPFMGDTVRVSHVQDKTVRVEPVGNSHFEAFNINVNYLVISGTPTFVSYTESHTLIYADESTHEELYVEIAGQADGFGFNGIKL